MNQSRFRYKFWAFFLLGSVLFVFGIRQALILSEAYAPLKVEFDTPSSNDVKSVIVIARAMERPYEARKDIPFRNSRLAIYKRNDKILTKMSVDFLCRSTSTGDNPPLDTDISSYIKNLDLNTTKTIKYGYASIPTGYYHLARHGKKFLISDWGRTDGKLALNNPMEIRYREYIQTNDGIKVNSINDQIFTVSHEKDGCFLHGTSTRFWSHRDALGCITLFDQDDPTSNSAIQNRGWNTFTQLVQDLGIYDSDALALLIVNRDALTIDKEFDFDKDEMPNKLGLIGNSWGRNSEVRIVK